MGRELMNDGAELAKEALTQPPGRRRRDAIRDAADHFMAAMGLAAMMQHNPFEERDDG